MTQFEKPLRHLSDPKSMNLKWYSPEMHMKSFVMPQFVKEVWCHSLLTGDKCVLSERLFCSGTANVTIAVHVFHQSSGNSFMCEL